MDVADQITAVYTSHLSYRHTWVPIFIWLLDTCVTNSYLMFSEFDGNWAYKNKAFTVRLSGAQVTGYLKLGNGMLVPHCVRGEKQEGVKGYRQICSVSQRWQRLEDTKPRIYRENVV